jgi:uncharacterized protein with PQ loop repeat
MRIYNILGIIGAIVLGFRMIPQIYLIIKNNNSENISYIFIILEIIASILLGICAYEFPLKNFPFLIANSFSFVLSSVLLFVVIRKSLLKKNESGSPKHL